MALRHCDTERLLRFGARFAWYCVVYKSFWSFDRIAVPPFRGDIKMEFRRVIIRLGIAGALCVNALTADAVTITFDEPIVSPNFSHLGGSFLTQDFHFQIGPSNTATVHLGGNFCGPPCPSNGTNHLWNQSSGLSFGISISESNDAPFSLLSVDLAESSVGINFEARRIDVTGFQSSGSTVLASLFPDLVNDGVGGKEYFETFDLPDSFTDLISVGHLDTLKNLRFDSGSRPPMAEPGKWAFGGNAPQRGINTR